MTDAERTLLIEVARIIANRTGYGDVSTDRATLHNLIHLVLREEQAEERVG